jgi:hypothetical protein
MIAATEDHLWREFAAIDWRRDPLLHFAKVDDKVRRHETEARVLRELRNAAFGVAQEASTVAKYVGVPLPINPNCQRSSDVSARA